MNCPMCGSRTRVLDSRHFDTPPKRSSGIDRYKAEVAKRVGWYTSDWVYRRRVCPSCKKEFKTTELIIEDLDQMCLIINKKMNDND
tara:strand:- start:50271 stop:50528 length:258 start_codon:yes stop_codon:yes gene_type:complete